MTACEHQGRLTAQTDSSLATLDIRHYTTCTLHVHYTTCSVHVRHFGYQGILDPDSTLNDFSEWNHVVLWYCDGDSWRGNLDEPFVWPDPDSPSAANVSLFFRGWRVRHLESNQRPSRLPHASRTRDPHAFLLPSAPSSESLVRSRMTGARLLTGYTDGIV